MLLNNYILSMIKYQLHKNWIFLYLHPINLIPREIFAFFL